MGWSGGGRDGGWARHGVCGGGGVRCGAVRRWPDTCEDLMCAALAQALGITAHNSSAPAFCMALHTLAPLLSRMLRTDVKAAVIVPLRLGGTNYRRDFRDSHMAAVSCIDAVIEGASAAASRAAAGA